MTTLQFDEWQDNGGTPVLRINAGVLEVWDGSAWSAPGGFQASGGDYEGEANGYYYHIFTSSGTLTVTRSGSVEVLLIAGGGAGGQNTNAARACGGGGAGGLLVTTASVSVGAKSIVIGDGGAATFGTAVNGSDSTALGLTAFGGGGGAEDFDTAAGTGGSGGGGTDTGANANQGAPAIGDFTPIPEFAGVGEQGCYGGNAQVNGQRGGGGGGAGSPGHDTNGTLGQWKFDNARGGTDENFGEEGSGGWGARLDSWGIGATSVAGTAIGDEFNYTPNAGGTAQAYFFAGGGTGGHDAGTGVFAGPPGGGGDGASTNTAAQNGVDGLGGGGGGGANGTQAGGDGGSGLCIVRYPV